MAKVVAVCRSDKKGIQKQPIIRGEFEEGYGLVDDAHADSDTHRQVSLLAMESIDRMRAMGLEVGHGDFAENITTEGIDVASLPVGTHLLIGAEVTLEITQIGKECHTRCAIYRQVGSCIMPEEGVFGRVVRGGVVEAGDEIRIVE